MLEVRRARLPREELTTMCSSQHAQNRGTATARRLAPRRRILLLRSPPTPKPTGMGAFFESA